MCIRDSGHLLPGADRDRGLAVWTGVMTRTLPRTSPPGAAAPAHASLRLLRSPGRRSVCQTSSAGPPASYHSRRCPPWDIEPGSPSRCAGPAGPRILGSLSHDAGPGLLTLPVLLQTLFHGGYVGAPLVVLVQHHCHRTTLRGEAGFAHGQGRGSPLPWRGKSGRRIRG